MMIMMVFSDANDDDTVIIDIEDVENDSDIHFKDSDSEESVLDLLMFKESNLLVRDVVTMISAFSLRFSVSDEGRIQLMDMFKLAAGPKFEHCKISKYRMEQCVPNQDEYMTYYYYCSKCYNQILYSINAANYKLKTRNVVCEKCEEKVVLSNTKLLNDIVRNLSFRNDNKNSKGIITDIYGGEIQQKIIQEKNTKNLILLNFSTDGAPLTKSGKNSFWALQVTINSLSPKLRYKNILIAGMLIVKREPNPNLMNLYMSKFVDQINLLYENGISRRIEDTDITFNHSNDVAFALKNNKITNGVKGDSILNKLPYFDLVWSFSYEYMHGGICLKGDSILNKLPYFDLVWSFSYEYMHGLLLGVTLQLLNEWKNGSTEYKIKKKLIEMIEKKFLTITPNKEIHRLPRSGIIAGSNKAKASELRSWLLCYSLPCLTGTLHPDALNHYSLLVKSSYTLLKSQITENELKICEDDLTTFVVNYEMYYKETSMTFNVHTLLHICDSIRKTGLLCTNSAFPFESNIYNLKTFVNGSKGMDRQIARKSLQSLMFKTGDITSNSEKSNNFCANLFNPQRLKVYYDVGGAAGNVENVTYVGKGIRVNNVKDFPNCIAYKKCIFNGSVYHSTQYKRAKKTNDTTVLLKDDRFATILYFLKTQNDKRCYLKLSILNVPRSNPFSGIYHIKKVIRTENYNDSIVILPIDSIEKKAIFVDLNCIQYVCTLPNNIEIQ
ncbi:hypothetical protein TSAR_001119 [Trichomalopsis sarcophagae]|uniref:Uncharacterized protein n=1 Tax=Trichomalopsis sarcophagae TaxID=543379 RepID=A0A232ESS6_9HYME|nr:hypothetical protein TSAR_001119 [Trichomalopsis sarcophagae]